MMLAGRIDWATLGKVYRPNQEIPEATVRRLFKQKGIQAMVRSELMQILNDQGITEDTVAEMYMDAFTVGKETKNASAMRSVAKDLASMIGMKTDDRGVDADWNYMNSYKPPQLEPHDGKNDDD
jgi:hypothetical protein